MFNNTKNIFLFILLTFVASSCDDTDATEQDGHTDADGMEIVEMVGEEEGLLYSECQGEMLNNFAAGIPSGNEWDLTVHFLNDECEELEHDDDDHEGHDHGDDHGDEEHGYTFELESLSAGTTTFTVTLMHQGHIDYTSQEITITVE